MKILCICPFKGSVQRKLRWAGTEVVLFGGYRPQTVALAVLWSRNFLFPLRFQLSKSFGSGSDISFDLPFITDFILKKSGFFMFFKKDYQPNSHAGFYSKWILIFIYYLSWPGARAGTWSQSREPELKLRHSGSSSRQKFRLLAAPAPQH